MSLVRLAIGVPLGLLSSLSGAGILANFFVERSSVDLAALVGVSLFAFFALYFLPTNEQRGPCLLTVVGVMVFLAVLFEQGYSSTSSMLKLADSGAINLNDLPKDAYPMWVKHQQQDKNLSISYGLHALFWLAVWCVHRWLSNRVALSGDEGEQ